MSKSLFKSKTFWVNAISTTLEVAQLLSGTQIVPPGTLTIVTGVLNIALRKVTSQPVHVVAPSESR